MACINKLKGNLRLVGEVDKGSPIREKPSLLAGFPTC